MLSRNRFRYLAWTCHNSYSGRTLDVNKQRKFYGRDGGQIIRWRNIAILLILWFAEVWYYERIVVQRVIKRCEWDSWEEWPANATPHRVALFADPQLLDCSSYPNRTWVINEATKVVADNYHRRNWKFIQYWLSPDTNFFLGDLFDGGRYNKDAYWMEQYKRFNNIFPKVPFKKTIMSVPGNHDIGFNVLKDSFRRFTAFFGEASNYMDVGNHTFVLVDTISMSDKENPQISSIPKNFLHEFASGYHPLPKIMLSHIPLWRDPKKLPCGPGRESAKPFPIERGKDYQTVIDGYITPEVLSKVQPDAIFCGDDHDYCHIIQKYEANGVTKTAEEYSVKSCAMNMGIKYPAIQLISLWNPDAVGSNSGKKTFQTEVCYLPDANKALCMYLLSFIGSTFWLVFKQFFPFNFKKYPTIGMRSTNEWTIAPLSLPLSTRKNIMKIEHEVEDKLNIKIKGFLISYGIFVVSVMCIFMYFFKTI
ncbi:hypothetical protein BZL39_E07180 [Zygosaccharomyces parabailii]|nr:hypothetical protein BZL39_E07180 [Zygosaccharomyces parabailii]